MKKVFLGGTTAGSKWRDELIPKLEITYFNPVVPEWNDAAKAREIEERKTADYLLYTITPGMKGVYSIAEVIDDTHLNPKKTVLCILEKDGAGKFTKEMLTSLNAVADMVERNGGAVCRNLDEVAKVLNGGRKKKAAQQYDPEVLQAAMELLQLTVLVAEGKAPKVPGLDMLIKNLDKRDNTLSARSKKFMANSGKLRSIVKEITEAAEAAAAEGVEVDPSSGTGPRTAANVETPETAKKEVPQVREICASSKNTGDKETVNLYDSRVRPPESGKDPKPSNVHDEMLGLVKKATVDVSFGVGNPEISKEDSELLGKLY